MSYLTSMLISVGMYMGSCALEVDFLSDSDVWTDVHSTLPHQGMPRPFWMYSGTEKPSAIIFALVEHSLAEDICERWHKEELSKYGIRREVKTFNATLITPCPLYSPYTGRDTPPGWGYNAGTCCQSNKSVNDIDFAKQLIPEVERRIGVTGLQVYAIGVSNGGMLAEALLCYNIVSQAASVAGILTLEPGLEKGFKVCDDAFKSIDNRVQRVIKIHSKDDTLVPYNGSYNSDVPFMKYPSVESDFSRWAERMGCDRESREKIGEQGYAVIEGYKTCPEGKKVYLASMEGVGHVWPPGNFSASTAIFEFFYGRL